jgi:hypothetical protein
MAATLHDDVFDAALNVVKNNTENLYICSSMPTTFAEASSTYKLGVKATPSFTGPADHTSGRKVTVDAITDGTVSGTGTAGYFALTDDSASKLLAAQALNATQAVTSGNTFTLTAAIIAIPDPTA